MDFIIKKLEDIDAKISNQSILSKEFLTLAETALYLGHSKSSMYRMTSKKEIPFYNPGGKKIYFKRRELDDWISKGRVNSYSEVVGETDQYLARINTSTP